MEKYKWNGVITIPKRLQHLVVGLVSLLIINLNNSCNLNKVEMIECVDPHCELIIQPYNNFSIDKAKIMSMDLKNYIQENLGISITKIIILPNQSLTPNLLNDNKTRYSADKILKAQKSKVSSHKIIIGLTNEDISTHLRDKSDWGIQGLAIIGGNSCIISTYRLNRNVPLWKPVVHEFIHAFWNMHHCSENNPYCLMQDGHGKPNWNKKNNLCKTCKSYF